MTCRAAWVLVVLAAGCADAESIAPPPAPPAVAHTVGFTGFMFDGATGTRIDSYTLSVQAGAELLDGEVAEGRYMAGPVSAWDDFTVGIVADGFRPFRSHNAQIGVPDELAGSDDIADIGSHQTLHFDAYLFPSNLASPAVTFTIATPNGEAPGGTVRLRPTGRSLLEDDGSETPSGIPGQLWTNDEDLQADSISRAFSDGTLGIAEGDLVYGVTYQISIYDVIGFQPLEDTYTAGVETDKTFELTEELGDALEILSSTATNCTPPNPAGATGAVITLQLNHAVEEVADAYPGGAAEALDDALAMSSPNEDADMDTNDLVDDVSPLTQERGVIFDINGDTVTISWNSMVGLMPLDPQDPIVSVTYGGLGDVMIQREGAPSSAVSLSALLGGNTLPCPP